ncbi:MAG TPA: hypothetical protein VFC78_12015 [Tepidisphaeraceae bacterium]|nr:hypothetical protein [Tepidisphaeraceae bacterium]
MCDPSTSSRLAAFEQALLRAIRLMDQEACKLWNNRPTGLSFYGAHFRPNLTRPPTETSWTRRLEQLLPLFGFPTRREFRYPDSGESCDSLVMLEDGSTLWLETKGAWKKYWQDEGKEGTYWSYLLHPLAPNLGKKDHTAALDLRKLSSLRRPQADFVGLLLLGFDGDNSPMDPDVSHFMELASLGRAPWSTCSAGWADQYRVGCGVKTWLWHRPVESINTADEPTHPIIVPSATEDTTWADFPRADRILRWFLEAELLQGERFRWEMPIGHLLRLPAATEFVVKAGNLLRKSERRFGKYDARNYLSHQRFDALLASLRDIIARGVHEQWSVTATG